MDREPREIKKKKKRSGGWVQKGGAMVRSSWRDVMQLEEEKIRENAGGQQELREY